MFQHFGVRTVHANDDADLLIAETAIAKAQYLPMSATSGNTGVKCLL